MRILWSVLRKKIGKIRCVAWLIGADERLFCWSCKKRMNGKFCSACGESLIEESKCPQCKKKFTVWPRYCEKSGLPHDGFERQEDVLTPAGRMLWTPTRGQDLTKSIFPWAPKS